MQCLDCSTTDRSSDAVGVCTTCGAGVCGEHLSLDTHVITSHGGVGNARVHRTRAVTCSVCDPVLTEMHHTHFASAVARSGAEAH